MPEEKVEFKVGDKCKAFGREGTIVDVTPYIITAEFIVDGVKQLCGFSLDGFIFEWQLTPSLERVE